jgi:REP element-mobilizing transposase RayT
MLHNLVMRAGRFVDTRREQVAIRCRRLPHWRAEGGIYFVTFRLADSLPKEVVDAMLAMPKESPERIRLGERELDKSFGSCVLRNPRAAALVMETIQRFDPERYGLWSCCVMPNHIHAVLSPADTFDLEGILHSGKSYTSKRINDIVGRRGRLWEPEYFDHLVRNGDSLDKFIRYIEANPVKARLGDWPWVYVAPADQES